MTNEELQIHADKFLRNNFNLTLDIPIRISKRMKSKLGAFQIKYKNNQIISKEIVLSQSFILHNSNETILDVLYHECVHYALFIQNKPYRDSDAEFIKTLERLGIAKTRTYKYKGASHLYECKKCNYQFSKKVKGYDKRYICGKCRGKFLYRGLINQD